MISCEKPIRSGPNRGLSARGTRTGYERHRFLGEQACEECLLANAERSQAVRSANPDLMREVNASRREYAAAWRREWRRKHPDKARLADMVHYHRRRKNVPKVPFTRRQLQERLSMFAGCWMCGAPAQQVDHVIPLARGGYHALANLRPACGPCNARKGTSDWRVFA